MTLNIFKNDAFSLTSLTASINEMPFTPGQAGALGIFDEGGIYTDSLMIENEQGSLVLIPSTPSGSSPTYIVRDPRQVRTFYTARRALADKIYAKEIQNKRQFGTENQLVTAQSEVNKRAVKMLKSHDATVEYGRIGAIRGVVYDADGTTVMWNLFNEFGISQTQVDFVLGTTTTDILTKCREVRENIQDALGAQGTDDITVTVFCGKDWYDKFIAHTAVKEAYKYYQTVQSQLNPLQQDLRYKGFTFGGLTFVVYRGVVKGPSGLVTFVPADKAYAFATNIPELFITRYSPADYMETANTEGLPRYMKMAFDPEWNRYVAVETQSNPISLCTRPASLIELITSN